MAQWLTLKVLVATIHAQWEGMGIEAVKVPDGSVVNS